MDYLPDLVLVVIFTAFGWGVARARDIKRAVRRLKGHKHDWHIDGKDAEGIRWYCTGCPEVKHA